MNIPQGFSHSQSIQKASLSSDSDKKAWLSRWFVVITYDKMRVEVSEPTLYEEDFSKEEGLIVRSKFLPEMVGLTREIQRVKEIVSMSPEMRSIFETLDESCNDGRSVFLFNLKGCFIKQLPFDARRHFIN